MLVKVYSLLFRSTVVYNFMHKFAYIAEISTGLWDFLGFISFFVKKN